MIVVDKELKASTGGAAILQGTTVLLVLVLGVAAAAFMIWWLSSGAIPPTPADQILVHSRAGVPYNVAPEPVERLIFIVLAALCPAGLVAYFWRSKIRETGIERQSKTRFIAIWLPIFAAFLLIPLFIFSDFIPLLFFPTPWAKSNKALMFMAALVIALAAIWYSQRQKTAKSNIAKIVWWVVALAAIALQILSYRISSISSVTLSQAWSVHVDAALYALNQVVHGKTIIADLPSQYGFFPEIVAPIFKVIGLSVLSLTVFFAVLHAGGLILLALLLRRHIANPLLSMLTLLTISIPMSLFLYLNGSVEDIYIQYFPVRFFWPAAGLLLFSVYASNPTNLLFLALGVVSGVAVFWNIDTGVPIFVAIGATLLVKPLVAQRSALQGITAASLFAAIGASTLTICFIALRIKAGVPLDLAEALAAQKIFYLTGFGMIPMPISPDPWQAVLIIYAIAAITALSGWRRNPGNSLYDVLLCGSVLGLGLFVYFQGRSHVNCLILVSWPAILLGGVLSDLLLRSARIGYVNKASVIIALPFLVFVSLGAITFIASSPNMSKDAMRKISTLDVKSDPVVTDEMEFMRQTYRGRHCLILSQRQAIYAAELNIPSPLSGPGIAETLLQRDLDRLVSAALNDPLECIYLGVTEGSITFVDVKDAALMARYPVISKNPLGTMLLLEPSKPAIR